MLFFISTVRTEIIESTKEKLMSDLSMAEAYKAKRLDTASFFDSDRVNDYLGLTPGLEGRDIYFEELRRDSFLENFEPYFFFEI